jgi:hypothetical protein
MKRGVNTLDEILEKFFGKLEPPFQEVGVFIYYGKRSTNT